jgi:DNA invertase Pin-like site-specific DNA recombinase
MVTSKDVASASVTTRAPSRAAQYVRMSTEQEQYSPENQLDVIHQYAATHNLEIVRGYFDHGRSGLNIAFREGLNRLMADVEAKRTNFTSLLGYDVSRWGRLLHMHGQISVGDFRIRSMGRNSMQE